MIAQAAHEEEGPREGVGDPPLPVEEGDTEGAAPGEAGYDCGAECRGGIDPGCGSPPKANDSPECPCARPAHAFLEELRLGLLSTACASP
jgi:hypothetical protein